MKRKKTTIMNEGKAQMAIHRLNLKNATPITLGNEECVLIDCDEKYIENLQKGYSTINGAFSKKGFILCNLHNIC
ncbi:MAG: hypothetical protein ACJASM_000907 [Salibacteraceae bacterium]|jgi:hypothetical protein